MHVIINNWHSSGKYLKEAGFELPDGVYSNPIEVSTQQQILEIVGKIMEIPLNVMIYKRTEDEYMVFADDGFFRQR